MTPEDFRGIMGNRLRECRRILGVRAGAYAKNDDRLWNFKKIGNLNNIQPEKALMVLTSKQIVAIADAIDDYEKNGTLDAALVDEYITDIINYMLLLDGLINEP